MYKFLQSHTKYVDGQSHLAKFALLWDDDNVFKLIKKVNLQLTLFCLEQG